MTTDRYLDQLAHLIAANGISQYESDVARLGVRLQSQGHGGPIVDLLIDHTASTVARERAFGIAVGQLARSPARTDAQHRAA